MGVMQQPSLEPGRLIVTPHPMLLDGQRNVVWEARAGESLYTILQRNVPELDGQRWEVCIGGRVVERHLWHKVRPKQGQVIEVRGGVGRSALSIVAMIALTYFTFGAGAWAGGVFGAATGAGTFFGASGMLAATLATGTYMAGAMLINKVLGPKPARVGSQQQNNVYSISGARNQLRPYEPIPLLFGRVRITPDLLSRPYTWYEGNDQYLGLLLCAGINVGRVETLYNGDTALSNYEGVQVYHAGYSQMPEQTIPLYSNADTIDGAELTKDSAWVERTTSIDTVRIQINLEYVLGGVGTSGKSYSVGETVEAQYRPVGSSAWLPLVSRTFRSDRLDVRRATLARDVDRGQYEVRVRLLGQGNYEGKNTQKNDFQWTQLTSVQADDADYTGLARSGVRIKATGQFNGSPDELRGVAVAAPIPEWDGDSWVTRESSNPGAQCLAYARGIHAGSRLLAGMALDDAQIDIESWKAFTLHCAANGYNYDFYAKDARSHADVLSSIARAGFGEITWAGGRLGVVWAAQEQPLSGVVNMATIRKGQFQVDYALANAADGIEYTYVDSTDWQTKTLRVPAPGVTTMLNPAQVSGEGVGTEQHAARLARWHLAQSLYQYKDIGYSTDIEHLSYQRLSVLALQHDMTQWGHGGRVQAVENVGGVVTLTLDEPVPAPASGNAYIGLRIPGERVYRVMRVQPFAGESRMVTLAEPWPTDAALPGGSAANPAHDTIWVYDFKQTPGYRVRVTSIEPEGDLKGAAVRVVPEGPEFWDYVLTGHYTPAPNQSLLQTRPVASNLRVTEAQVVQGNTQFTELTATFDVSGPVGNVLVLAAGADQELQEVAQTRTRTATWRVPAADAYRIVVRPFSPEGEAGVAVSTLYATVGADVPPVLVDLFSVEQRSGGVRLYTWGWLDDTIRSADFAGVEIRYVAGNVPAPEWDAMTPVGETGYHTAPFEAVMPQSGQWTFACRSRNSSGVLSASMRVVVVTLGANLGEQLGDIDGDLGDVSQRLIEQAQKLGAAIEEIDFNAETIIKQSLEQYELAEGMRTNRAYIDRLEETMVTEDEARAIAQETLGASVGDLRATVQEAKEAVANIDGRMSAGWSVKAQVAANGRYYLAGFSVGAYTDGETVQTEVLALANTFGVLSTTGDDQVYAPFIVDQGVVRIAKGMIGEGWINNAMIGNEIKSDNYLWDTDAGIYRGWKIDKSGWARFAGDIEVRGTVIASAISGRFQQTITFDWDGNLHADYTGYTSSFTLPAPVRYGDSHRPILLLELTMENGQDHNRDGVISIERLVGNTWQTVRSKTFTQPSGTRLTNVMIVEDAYTSVARQYRVKVSKGTNSWGSWALVEVHAVVYGVR